MKQLSVADCRADIMAAKSPTSIRTREIIGDDQFSARREVFDKHNTVFLPPSPTLQAAKEAEADGKMTNFNRNGPTYSSMRESRTEGRDSIEFRPRKYSDNFTSDLNQSDDFDYRRSMTERTRRLSKLRRDFLNSNLHDPSSDSSFSRTGVRASMPARSASYKSTSIYKIESPNLYKFPFAEPYATPPPVRRAFVDLDDSVTLESKDKENRDPDLKPNNKSLPNGDNITKLDHQKLFQELVKRYSPQRKPVDWTLPPTKPRVIGAVPKTSTSESIDSGLGRNELRSDEEAIKHRDQDKTDSGESSQNTSAGADQLDENDSKVSLSELEEKNDRVAELSVVQRQLSREAPVKRPSVDKNELNIPKLIEKMNAEGEALESHSKTDKQKVKRKRSFLDKLLGRKRGDKNN